MEDFLSHWSTRLRSGYLCPGIASRPARRLSPTLLHHLVSSGAADGIRTRDLVLTKDALYRLSYSSLPSPLPSGHASKPRPARPHLSRHQTGRGLTLGNRVPTPARFATQNGRFTPTLLGTAARNRRRRPSRAGLLIIRLPKSLSNKKIPLFPGRFFIAHQPQVMERVMGIEPTYSAWKADALPLSYTRITIADFGLPIADCDVRPVPDHLVLAVLAEATMIATISCASSIRGPSRFLSIRPALASNSIQYCDSSASSTTTPNLETNSAFERARQAAR